MLPPLDATDWQRQIVLHGGTNQRIVGSREGRKTRGIGLAWERPEPRARGRGFGGRLRFEATYVRGLRTGQELFDRSAIDGLQLLSGVRLSPDRSPFYVEVLSGFHFVDRRTRDLSSPFNFAPTLGLGASLGRYDVGVRFSHISNADTKLPNNGLNLVSLVVGVRF